MGIILLFMKQDVQISQTNTDICIMRETFGKFSLEKDSFPLLFFFFLLMSFKVCG